MAKNLLLEIGLEEMPAHVVWPSIKQLEEKVSKFLAENSLTFESIETFSTPRRLAIRVTNIPDRQEDVQEEVKGPATKIAMDAEGNWSKSRLNDRRDHLPRIERCGICLCHKIYPRKRKQGSLNRTVRCREELELPNYDALGRYDV